jgi:hypothetical protein
MKNERCTMNDQTIEVTNYLDAILGNTLKIGTGGGH